ncbi:DUF29 family protein [Endozoicomonas sp.]|uniref:DUF29 family protein n=1 Tax=Endozoicomonas sp. TaxID=1892382 RepID=UPI00383BB396
MLPAAYHRAIEDAHDKTNLPASTFPEQYPWSFQQAVDKNFWPDDLETVITHQWDADQGFD